MKSFLLISFLFFSFFTNISAKELSKYDLNDIILEANNNNPEAQVYLGTMYRKGNNVPVDKVKAMEWYKKAAIQGYGEGQLLLAIMHYNRNGDTHNYPKAIEWFKKAAAQNNTQAQTWLGYIYFRGPQAYQDFNKAKKWFQMAQTQGDTKANSYLKIINSPIKRVVQNDSSNIMPVLTLLLFFPIWFLLIGYFAKCSSKHMVITSIAIFIGGLLGLFIAFACNGGAGGSSEMSSFAWKCSIAYLVIYYIILAKIIFRTKQQP
ncbi:MAG: sel1 repeat family protein [Sulfurimonas sp.]|nr:sel1 repeat family protein [Sulfurimonas sp.]